MARNRDRKHNSRKRVRKQEENSSEEEEYEVEKVKSHKVMIENGKSILKYLVKWIGYSDKDNTWEPADSLANAADLVDEYWRLYGGEEKRRQVMKDVQSRTTKRIKSEKPKKTELEQTKEESEEDESDFSESEVNDKTFRTNADWNDILKVKEVKYSKSEKGLEAVVRWADGKLAAYPTSTLAIRSPLKLVDFYEKFLVFEKA
ncbi:Chromo domain-containing protein 2 [Choanephora cucurbitarum]|uniref:Chromo domain-containing protein 2 n=1 Tax=Choanephora cucurbitarum TaxID=101091 RepID=A0A1C7NBQ6_9FUNG|nr:Chromo domain-containing protein 2 [Choanephora cucurbitarum]